MRLRYAEPADVLSLLHLDPDNPDHEAQIAHVERVEAGLCETFDEKTGTSFGVFPAPETRTVFLADGATRIPLQWGLREVDAVQVDGEVLDEDEYRLSLVDRDGIGWALDLDQALYVTAVTVTGVWGDQSQDDVPDDVRQALTLATVDQVRLINSSPAGEIGPDGLTIRPRNPWSMESVKEAVNRHRVKVVVL